MVAAQVAGPSQLPAETDEFVGRATELRAIDRLLRDVRLVTLVGPGGVGKTRAALRAARSAEPRYADRACLVELSAVHDPELVPHTVARRLGLADQAQASPRDALLAHLGDRSLLLILDTCEHLIDACAELAEAILLAAPSVTVLATSREPLDIDGETTFPIRPLPVGGDGTGEDLNPFGITDVAGGLFDNDHGPGTPADRHRGVRGGSPPRGKTATRSGSSRRGPPPLRAGSPSPTPTGTTWSGCAGGSTASRWPSNWPLCGSGRCRSPSWPSGWTTACRC